MSSHEPHVNMACGAMQQIVVKTAYYAIVDTHNDTCYHQDYYSPPLSCTFLQANMTDELRTACNMKQSCIQYFTLSPEEQAEADAIQETCAGHVYVYISHGCICKHL